jgi:DNA-binding transcriptional LysR family regulator
LIPVTIRQLTYFVAVAEHGGTAQAAQALNVSQPAISLAIKQLEETLGQSLFVRRHAHGLILTALGRQKLSEARFLLTQTNAWATSPEGGRHEGWVDIGCFVTLGPSHMPSIIRRFRQELPGIHVRLREANIEQLHDLLETGSVEVALMYDLNLARGVNLEAVGELRPHVLVSADHHLATRARVSLREIAEHPFILINLPHSREYFLSLFRLVGITPSVVMETQSLEMVRGMVANGQGVSLLVTRPHSEMSYDGRRLVSLEIEEAVPAQKVVIATSRQYPMTWMAHAFVRHVREHFSLL